MTLHTKVVLIDRKKIFVGSLNLDPRSIELNAEMGVLIELEAKVAEMMVDSDETYSHQGFPGPVERQREPGMALSDRWSGYDWVKKQELSDIGYYGQPVDVLTKHDIRVVFFELS